MSSAGSLFADDPIDGTEAAPDRLGRAAYANHIGALLDRVRDQSESSVLALIGAWGSGKSSVLDMVTLRVQGTRSDGEAGNTWKVAHLNPWTYSDVESLQNGFFRELRNALPKGAKWSEARKHIGEFGKALSTFAGLIPGVSAEDAIAATADAIAGDQGATAVKKAAEEALKKLKEPILIVMDDLDRLTPEELLLVFKLVRLVGRLPYVYYLLCYDEDTLLDILSRTDLVPREDSSDKRAREYLEKIIQVRLDLPALREHQALTLVDASLTHVLTTNAVSFDEENMDRFRTAFHDHILRRLATPRAINRYFAQVEAHYVLLREEIDFVDFLLLSWIRTAEPGVYKLLQSSRGELTQSGKSAYLAAASKETHQQANERWSRSLRNAGVDESAVDGVLAVLSQMFLPIRSARDNMEYSDYWMRDIARRQGVGHKDYFDRYFAFGVPEEDIPDSVVRGALAELAAESEERDVATLRARITTDTARVCRKLGAEHERGNVPVEALLVFLADAYGDLPGPGDLFLDPRRSVQLLASDLLPDVVPSSGRELLRRMGRTPHGARLVAAVVEKAHHGSSTPDGKKTVEWLDEATDETCSLVRATLDTIDVPLKDLDEELWRMIWSWRWLNHDDMRTWMREAVRSKQGWSLDDVLARIVSPAQIDGRSHPPLDMNELEPLLGVDYAIGELDPDAKPDIRPSDELEPTWENRMRLGKSLLADERQRRAATPNESVEATD
jgi:hypothetical protein